MILALLSMIVTLILVVGLHEAGHAIAAVVFSVKIRRIAIGFGKPLLTITTHSGCEWVWGRWPLGGYVELLNSRIQPVHEKEYPVCFDKKPAWVRCIILLSGGSMNMVVAWIGLTLFHFIGYQQYLPYIKAVVPNSIAAQAGFKAGDSILAFDRSNTPSWQAVDIRLVASLGKTNVLVSVKHSDGKQKQLHLDLRQLSFVGDSLWQGIGIEPDVKQIENVPGESFGYAIRDAVHMMVELLGFFLVMLKQIIMGRIPVFLLLGPIEMFDVAVHSFMQGISVFAYFISSLSLAVGLINLFPIPGLDGGSIVYTLVEKVRGMPISIALEILLYRLALIVFCVLLVQLLMNDLHHYLVGLNISNKTNMRAN